MSYALRTFRRELLTRPRAIASSRTVDTSRPAATSRGQDVTRDLSTCRLATEIISPFPMENTPHSPESIWDSILLWAVPKKRTSHSKKRMRMAHKYLKPKHHYQTCPQCGNLKLHHMLCGHCFKETMKHTAEVRRQREQELLATTEDQCEDTEVVVSSTRSSI